jgi:cytochrome c biogenesis protein CcmG/thiol:disulfide interchange protein DsbE
MRKSIFGIGVVVLIAAVVGLGFAAMQLASQAGARPKPGQPAPNFTLPLYANYQGGLGDRATLADLQGKVVVVNFWASWCIPCKDEAPALNAVAAKYAGRDVVLLGVNYLDVETDALGFLATYSVAYANGADLQQKIAKQYRITGVPETFVIDKDGIVREVIIQPITEQKLTEMIDKLL